RMGQADGDIYSTVGYAAPELGDGGPSPASDLYSVGRAIAVLATEFKGFQSAHRHALRGRDDEPIYQRYESLHRLLEKACHRDPNRPFSTAEGGAGRLVAARRGGVPLAPGAPPPADSRLFGPDPLGLRGPGDAGVDHLDLASLPALRMSPDDPATAFILG